MTQYLKRMPFYRPILLVIVSLILFVLLGLLYDDRIGFMLWSSNEVSPASKKAEHSLLRNETGRPNSTYENTSSHLSDLVGDVSKQETPPTIINETFVNQQQAIDAPSTDASKTTTASTAPPTIAWVIFTHFINKEERMERFIFPSLDTWLPKVFLVLSDMWQEDYMQWCEKDDRCDDRITTIFVDCGEGYAYEPTCCKLEKGLTRVLDEYPPFDWYMYSDDDCYWKTDFLQHILAPLPPDEPIALCPDGVHEIGYNNNCSKEYAYAWGNPVIFSRRALEISAQGFKLQGFQKQCTEFHLSQDPAVAVYFWMYGFPLLELPWGRAPIASDPSVGHGKVVGWHSVANKLNEGHMNYSELHSVSHDNMDFSYDYRWYNVSGFHQTQTYRTYGDPSTWNTTWHTFPVKDCQQGPNGS